MTTHIVNVSGGKDSTATYLRAIELGRPFLAVFADTGNEHDLVYEYIDSLPGRAGGPPIRTVRADFTHQLARHKAYILAKWPGEGIPDEVVQEAARLHEPTGNPYLDLCVLKGRFPSSGAQFCTDELKTNPIIEQAVLPALKDGPVLEWLGVRAEESHRRAKLPIWNRHESGCYVWRPIFRWTLADVWEIHTRHGVPRNPLYDKGMSRVGCMPCINCRKGELKSIADQFPEHIERIERWEAVLAKTSKRQASSFFAPINGDVLPIREAVNWSRTGRGGRQLGLFFQQQAGGGCTSDLALCETGEGS